MTEVSPDGEALCKHGETHSALCTRRFLESALARPDLGVIRSILQLWVASGGGREVD